jgi:hypothetical protein
MLPGGGQRLWPSAMGFVRKECGMGFAPARQAHKETMGVFLRLVNPGDSFQWVSRWHGGKIHCRREMTSDRPNAQIHLSPNFIKNNFWTRIARINTDSISISENQ